MDTSIRGDAAGILADGRAVAICKDLDFPATIRSDARLGVQLMLVPAADFEVDGWTHARMAILRGVENGFSVVRAARNGLMTLSDDRGRVWGQIATNKLRITALVGDLPVGAGSTLYRRYGDLLAWIALVFSATLLGLIGWRRNFNYFASRLSANGKL